MRESPVENAGMLTAPVNKIIPFSVVDGPGSRMSIFFQSCDFRCTYCHNPETQTMCRACGKCVEACPAHALSWGETGSGEGGGRRSVIWDPKACCLCDTCLKVCPHHSSPRIRNMTVDQVMAEVKKALPFIQGITVSGGECTLQEPFLIPLFRQVKQWGKTAFCDTNGQKDFRRMPELTELMDKAMLDVKAWDEETHIRLTGMSNRTVLDNLEYLGSLGKLYEVRTVVVPDFLPNEETVDQVSRIIRAFPGCRYKIIKFRIFGVRGELENHPSPTDEYMASLEAIARGNGVRDVILT